MVSQSLKGFAMWISGIKGSPLFVAIGGFRVKVKDPQTLVRMVSEASAPYIAQIVDAGRVASRDHLFMAAVNAAKSTETGMAVSKSITVEAILYASAQDQITKALTLLGVTTKSTTVALMVFAPSLGEAEKSYSKVAELLGEEDDVVLEIDDAKATSLRKMYDIGDKELEAAGGPSALGRLIVERGALLSLRR
jgi:tRNA threonylcarbamoyladenosine modification (KEOPS) complex Cgi121 subunit